VEEEEFLRAELKRIEARKKEREKKTQDLQKLITAADAGSAQGAEGASITSATPILVPNLGKKLTTEQKKIALLTAKKKSGKTPLAIRAREGSLSINSPDVFLGIKWPDFKSAGVFVRSQKLKLPSSVGTKKGKAIEQILQLLGLCNFSNIFHHLLFTLVIIWNYFVFSCHIHPNGRNYYTVQRLTIRCCTFI
jgi:DNA methyltransferase 1-associated protein 1